MWWVSTLIWRMHFSSLMSLRTQIDRLLSLTSQNREQGRRDRDWLDKPGNKWVASLSVAKDLDYWNHNFASTPKYNCALSQHRSRVDSVESWVSGRLSSQVGKFCVPFSCCLPLWHLLPSDSAVRLIRFFTWHWRWHGDGKLCHTRWHGAVNLNPG